MPLPSPAGRSLASGDNRFGDNRLIAPAILAVLTVLVLALRMLVVPMLGITLYIDEAQYWHWSEHLDWGYFSKPPGVAALIAASTALFGDGVLGVKVLAMLCYPATAWVTFFLTRRLFCSATALWTALVVLTLPIFSWLGLFVSTDALLTLFWSLACLIYLVALERRQWRWWWLLGVVCGLGLMSKYIMVAWMLAALVHMLAYHREQLRHVGPWTAGLVALALLAPNIWWNVANDFPTLKHTADITLHKQAAGGLASLGGFLGAQWLAFGPVLGGAFVWLLFGAREAWGDVRLRFLLWFSLPLWLIVCGQAFKSHANANWAAPAFVPAAVAAVVWLIRRARLRWVAVGLAVNVLLVGLTYFWTPLLQLADVPAASKRDPFTRARGWDELGRQLVPILQANPDAVLVAENRTFLSHLLYETRALHPHAAAWNPLHEKSDHFRLTTHLQDYLGHDVVFVTRDALPVGMADYFSAVSPATRLSARLDEANTLDMDVYLLHGFKGY